MRPKTPLDVRETLRSLGLRATPARIAVCKLLVAAGGPLTHADVADRLKDRGIDRATVFRNLTDLCEVGLARRVEVGDHVYRFEWRSNPRGGETHPHFVCVDCGEVQCLTAAATPSIRPTRRLAGQIHDVVEVLYRGHCSACAN